MQWWAKWRRTWKNQSVDPLTKPPTQVQTTDATWPSLLSHIHTFYGYLDTIVDFFLILHHKVLTFPPWSHVSLTHFPPSNPNGSPNIMRHRWETQERAHYGTMSNHLLPKWDNYENLIDINSTLRICLRVWPQRNVFNFSEDYRHRLFSQIKGRAFLKPAFRKWTTVICCLSSVLIWNSPKFWN